MENLIIPQDKLPWYKDADAGDVVEVILVMENALVNEVVLNSHNIRLYYVS